MTEPWVPKTQKGASANGLLWVLAVLAVAGLIAGIFFGVRWLTAPAKGKLQAREQINSGSYRIAAYDHFFDLCASVQGLEGQLAAQESALDGSTGDDRERIRANIAGIRGERAQAIADYNADASKDYTLAKFKSSKLPWRLSSEEEKTVCTA